MRISDWSSDVCSSDLARTAMAAMRWTYPQDALVALKRAATEAEAAKPVASGLVLAQLHFNYVVSGDRPSWRRSAEHTSELQSLMRISYAVFCLKNKKHHTTIL